MAKLEVQSTFKLELNEDEIVYLRDLITDEQLSKLIEKGVHEAFFEPRIQKRTFGDDIEHPCLMASIVTDLMRDAVNKEVKNYVTENADKFDKVVHDVVQEGIAVAVIRHFESVLQSSMWQLENNIRNTFIK